MRKTGDRRASLVIVTHDERIAAQADSVVRIKDGDVSPAEQ